MSEVEAPVSRRALVAMGVILLAVAFLAVFSNWQNARRARVESTRVTRFSPSPAPSASPAR